MRQETLMQVLQNPSAYSTRMLMHARDKLFEQAEYGKGEVQIQAQANRDKLTREITARPE